MHRVKHLIGSKGSVVNKIMTRTGTGIVVEAEVIPAFTRVNKSSVDAQIVSIKGSKEGTIIAQVCLSTNAHKNCGCRCDQCRLHNLLAFMVCRVSCVVCLRWVLQKLVFAVIDVGARILEDL